MAEWNLDFDDAQATAFALAEARKMVTRMTRQTFNRSQVLVPVDKGFLRASGRAGPTVVIGGQAQAEIHYDADYAAAVHNGRRALTIRPRSSSRRARLRFVVNGRVVYAREVYQPARAGRPFLLTAMQEAAAGNGFRVVSIG
jgi:hypothetical protein